MVRVVFCLLWGRPWVPRQFQQPLADSRVTAGGSFLLDGESEATLPVLVAGSRWGFSLLGFLHPTGESYPFL